MNLDTISLIDLGEKLRELAHKCYEADKAYIKADEEFNILDDNRKSYLATLTDAQEGKSTAEKERAALQTPEWAVWLEGFQAARMRSRIARVERDNAIRLWKSCEDIIFIKNKEWNREKN